MAITKKVCQYCNKTTDLTSEIDLGASGKLLVFACSHSYIEETLTAKAAQQSESTSLLERQESLLSQLEKAVPEYCETHQRNCIKIVESHTGKHLFSYQRDGIIRAVRANGKFIFADEMGLGKTVQGLVTIFLNMNEMLPAIFICKSIAKTNWLWETMDWLKVPAQVIYSSSETPWDMFKVHILSYDMVNRLDKMFKFSDLVIDIYKCNKCNREVEDKNGKLTEEEKQTCGNRTTITHQASNLKCECGEFHLHSDIKTTICDGKMILKPLTSSGLFGGIGNSLKDENKNAWRKIIDRCKTIIPDESHLIKNPEAQRTKAVKTLCSMVPHVMPMSGTLIKNNATEYFTSLNIVKPEKFWRYNNFCYNHVRYEFVKTAIGWSQKFTGLKDPEGFKELTKDFMIRRTTDEVLPDLPKLFKQQKYVELDEKFREIYDESEKDFAKWFDSASSLEIRTNLLAQLALLRHQTSLAKVDFTIDLALEFIMSTPRKLAIFTHHIDTRELLAERMIQFFRETSPDNPDMVTILTKGEGVQEEIEKFKTGDSRIIILSTLSHGESINLQFMSDSLLHERQWNPANEDQAISGRFRRIGQEAEHISCMIPIALGTIDEYFVQLVDGIKRSVVQEIDTGIAGDYNSSFVAELAEKIAAKGREKWKL